MKKITLNEILSEWEKDCKLDELDLTNAAYNIPKLHSKYLNWLYSSKRKMSFYILEKRKLTGIKRQYYLGELDFETLNKYGWMQFQKRVLKGELSTYIENDKDIINLDAKIILEKDKVESLTYIIKQISNNNFVIKNIIDYLRFTNGS